MEEYDVIIAGAGPAGGNCAKELSKLGYSVLLLESSKIIGEPDFSTAGTVNETMEAFKLPKKVTDSPWSSILFAGPHRRAEFVYKKRMGYVLNYKLLKQYLARKAKNNGTEVKTCATVSDVIFKNGFVSGVKVNVNGVNESFFAKIVVDATGGRSVLARKVELVKIKKGITTGLEYHMKNIDFERKGRLDFYLGGIYAPNGYAWIFPSGKASAKVGVVTSTPERNTLRTIDLLKNFAIKNSQTVHAKVTDLHGGSLYANGGITKHCADGFVVIGDAAMQINPLLGEGIRHALYSSKFAVEMIDVMIDVALGRKDVSKNGLESYNQKWKDYVGKKWSRSYYFQRFACTLNDNNWDDFVKIFSQFTPEEFFEILFHYRFGLFKKVLPQIIKLFPKFALSFMGSSSSLV